MHMGTKMIGGPIMGNRANMAVVRPHRKGYETPKRANPIAASSPVIREVNR
jgi:hypothetical protein